MTNALPPAPDWYVEQTLVAASPLVDKMAAVCRDQPADVVMMALAELVANGIALAMINADVPMTEAEAIGDHVELVRFWIGQLQRLDELEGTSR
jgi:hypothetical protein